MVAVGKKNLYKLNESARVGRQNDSPSKGSDIFVGTSRVFKRLESDERMTWKLVTDFSFIG